MSTTSRPRAHTHLHTFFVSLYQDIRSLQQAVHGSDHLLQQEPIPDASKANAFDTSTLHPRDMKATSPFLGAAAPPPLASSSPCSADRDLRSYHQRQLDAMRLVVGTKAGRHTPTPSVGPPQGHPPSQVCVCTCRLSEQNGANMLTHSLH